MPKLIIRIAGGCVTEVSSETPGIVVEIYDYDTEGVDDDNLESDEEGDYYAKSIYET
jgi:hypothetical protein